VVGPETAAGGPASRRSRKRGLTAFSGPGKQASQLRGQGILQRRSAPNSIFRPEPMAAFTKCGPNGLAYVRKQGAPIVVQGRGLEGAGKGVGRRK